MLLACETNEVQVWWLLPDRQSDTIHRVRSDLMHVFCMSWRSKNEFTLLYLLVEVEGRVQYD